MKLGAAITANVLDTANLFIVSTNRSSIYGWRRQANVYRTHQKMLIMEIISYQDGMSM